MAKKESKYLKLVEKTYNCNVSLVQNQENGKVYVNYDLVINGKKVSLTMNNYNSFVNDYIVEQLKQK